MIGRLTGVVVEDGADGVATLDVRGVGYEVACPLGTLGRAERAGEGELTLHVHTHVREDALCLYGFATREDRLAFRALIAVSSVGPKIALGILGVLTAGELAEVIARGEAPRLVKIPGVGKRTAERLLLELEGKLPLPAARSAPAVEVPRPKAGGEAATLQAALTNLGYRPAEAERAISALGDRVGVEPLGDLVRAALGLLAR